MYLKTLTLDNFRNFTKQSFSFGKTNYIHGDNASGKTNILEAIYLLCNGRSFQAKLESDLINWDKGYSRVGGTASDKTKLAVYLERTATARTKKILKVGENHRHTRTFCTQLNCVLFKPQDLETLDGSPSLRRSFLDEVITSCKPETTQTINQFQNVVRQRNKLLERIREGLEKPETLSYWDLNLVQLAQAIETERKHFLAYTNQALPQILAGFSLLSASSNREVDIFVAYHEKKLSREQLNKAREKEIAAGRTLHGPHRSDYQVLVDGRDLSTFGSRGQQRVAVFGLKRAHMQYLTKITGQPPLLLLDDIFSELDSKTVNSVIDLLSSQQTFITTADIEGKNKSPGHQVAFFPL